VTNFAKDTRQLHRATSAQVNELLLVDGDDHASELFSGKTAPPLLSATLRFQRAYA
jgi:hypothetical protein